MKHPASGDTERIQNLLNKGTENILLCEFTTYPEINSKTDFNTIDPPAGRKSFPACWVGGEETLWKITQ